MFCQASPDLFHKYDRIHDFTISKFLHLIILVAESLKYFNRNYKHKKRGRLALPGRFDQ